MRRKSAGYSDGQAVDASAESHPSGTHRHPRLASRRGHSSRDIRIVTVTGTSGKTTTAWLAAAVLAEAGLRVGVLSDLGCVGLDDEVRVPGNYARNGRLAKWLVRLAKSGCSHAVVELSSTAIEGGCLAGLVSDTVVVTGVAKPAMTRRHDESPASAVLSRTRTASAAIGTLTPGGCLITGARAHRLGKLRRHLPDGAKCLTAGLTNSCDVTATPVEAGLFGRMVLASCAGQIIPLTLDPPVVPFVRDCLLALAVGARYGIPLDVAVRGLEAAGGVPGRVERIARGQDAAVFIDTPSSGHALSATLSSLRRLTPGRLCVIADESLVAGLGDDEFGPIVARHCDDCVLVPTAVLSADAGDRELAAYARIDRLLGALGEGDCVLVAGEPTPLGGTPSASETGRFPLASLVDGWLQLAHGQPSIAGRGAA